MLPQSVVCYSKSGLHFRKMFHIITKTNEIAKKRGITMKTGLVLEGGAMRGLFTAGVMDVLMEHGIQFDGAIGVSAGAAFGCNYKSRSDWAGTPLQCPVL